MSPKQRLPDVFCLLPVLHGHPESGGQKEHKKMCLKTTKKHLQQYDILTYDE